VRKKLAFTGLILVVVLTLVTGCGQPKTASVTLTVSAAGSLKDVLNELKATYTHQHPDIQIAYNFAASGPLEQQIEEGAPVDVFISAGKPQMDALAQKGLIVSSSRKDLLSNTLVLIARPDTKITGVEDLAGSAVKRIAIGAPASVPAGQYAEEALTNLKLWDKLQPKLVQGNDVRQVLTYVEQGDVDAGIVYRTDAAMGKNIKVVADVPASSYQPVDYPIAVIKASAHPQEARAFAAFLESDQAAAVFKKYGFVVLGH